MATTPRLRQGDRDELRLLYQVTVSDIAYFKQQQWSISNYALTLEAALLFIAYQMLACPLTLPEVWVLVVLSWAVVLAALAVIERLETSILQRRARLENVRAQFGQVFRNAWRFPKERALVRWLLEVVLLLSSSVATWLILLRQA